VDSLSTLGACVLVCQSGPVAFVTYNFFLKKKTAKFSRLCFLFELHILSLFLIYLLY
jgi:hypothetical protein